MVPIADACVVDRFSVLAAVSLPDTELAIVISRPSRIQAVPSPSTSRGWNGDHLSWSSRAGMVRRIGGLPGGRMREKRKGPPRPAVTPARGLSRVGRVRKAADDAFVRETEPFRR